MTAAAAMGVATGEGAAVAKNGLCAVLGNSAATGRGNRPAEEGVGVARGAAGGAAVSDEEGRDDEVEETREEGADAEEGKGLIEEEGKEGFVVVVEEGKGGKGDVVVVVVVVVVEEEEEEERRGKEGVVEGVGKAIAAVVVAELPVVVVETAKRLEAAMAPQSTFFFSTGVGATGAGRAAGGEDLAIAS